MLQNNKETLEQFIENMRLVDIRRDYIHDAIGYYQSWYSSLAKLSMRYHSLYLKLKGLG